MAETLPSEIAQVTSVTFSGLQRKRNLSFRKHHERHIGIFSNFEKRLSLLHAIKTKLMANVLILCIRV